MWRAMVQNLVNIKNKFTGNCLIQSFNSNPILIQTLSRPKVPLDGEALDNKAFSLLARHQAAMMATFSPKCKATVVMSHR